MENDWINVIMRNASRLCGQGTTKHLVVSHGPLLMSAYITPMETLALTGATFLAVLVMTWSGPCLVPVLFLSQPCSVRSALLTCLK